MDNPSEFEQYRRLLFSIAYRMLGSVMEAEDIVQDAFIRYQATPLETIQSHKALLTTIVTRLCLNRLSSAQHQREQYIGPWLPEPLITETRSDFAPPAARMETYESISMAFLVLLERLSPAERAVFLLREVFDYEYEEIAAIVGKSEPSCRQLFSRARKHIAANRPRYETTPEKHRLFLERFGQAVQAGQMDALMNMLADDVVLWTDGGGKRTAALYPLYGREAAAQLMIGTTRKLLPANATSGVMEINGEPAIVIRVDGKVWLLVMIELAGETIKTVRIIANPDKLAHLD